MSENVAFFELPPEAYPMRIEFVDVDNRIVHEIDIPTAGAVDVPGNKAMGAKWVRLFSAGQLIHEEELEVFDQ